jgi:phosphatidylinositol alpha-1,6-mannosyltransferase
MQEFSHHRPILASANFLVGGAAFSPGHGGISRVARMTARVLIEAGSNTKVLSFLDGAPVALGDCTTIAAHGSRLYFAMQCYLASTRYSHFFYDSASIARAHPKLSPLYRAYAVWMHGIEVWHGLTASTQKVVEKADLRIANSQFTINQFRQLHNQYLEAQICWLATEEDDPPTKLADFNGPPCVLILARVDSTEGYKGHVELVGAWPKVVSAIPGARLVIAGAGSGLERLRSVVGASPAAAHIEVTGFVPENRLPTLWRRIHVLAMPSRNEGFGLVYVEAMRQGVPVLASIHDAGQEVNQHGVTGFNVNLDREGQLAECIVTLLRDPDLMCKMGQAGHKRWDEHFRFSAFRSRLIPIVAKFVRANS